MIRRRTANMSPLSPSWIRISVVLLMSLQFLVHAQGRCWMCGSSAVTPYDLSQQTSDGRTCETAFEDLAVLTTVDATCQNQRASLAAQCCPSGNPAPAQAPISTESGNEPTCPICIDGSYPGNPGVVIVARYVGQFTCAQLYDRGNNGLIDEAMCGPLQDYAVPICGCGFFNPNPTVPAPVAAPVQRPTAPPPTGTFVGGVDLGNRKVPPAGGKFSQRISGSRGGAASRERNNRLLRGT